MIEFFLPCLPPKTTAQTKRLQMTAKGPVFFKSAKSLSAKALIDSLLIPHAPAKPLTGAIALTITVTWPFTNEQLSTKAKREAAAKGLWHTTKPDLDNWLKQFQDCLVDLRFIAADQMVCSLRLTKRHGENPGVYCVIEELTGEGE